MTCKKVTVFYNKKILIISKILHGYYTIYMNKQLVFGVIAVIFATALIASLVVDQASARQSISQRCTQDQSSSTTTPGSGARLPVRESILPIPIFGSELTSSNSGVTGSGNNVADCTNTNNAGNAAS
jgi:hypothetical protein